MKAEEVFELIGANNEFIRAFSLAAGTVLSVNWLLELDSMAIHTLALLTIAFYVKIRL